MIKVFTTNKDGKIELTKDELKALLDEVYWCGYRANSRYIYSTPVWPTPYFITCNAADMNISADDIKGGTITNTCEIEFGIQGRE